jgi:hypothetical protein
VQPPKRAGDDVAARVKLLPAERRDEYLLRLVRNEPGLSRTLVNELRGLGPDAKPTERPAGERVTHANLQAEAMAIRAQREAARIERERQAHEQRLRELHEHEDTYWRQLDRDMARGSGSGYDAAASLLAELRESATHFQDPEGFGHRFQAWMQPHLRRPAFVKRLRDRRFALPQS